MLIHSRVCFGVVKGSLICLFGIGFWMRLFAAVSALLSASDADIHLVFQSFF